MNANWEVVIGLEIHNQLATRSKIFSGASTAYGAAPNTQACLVDLGYPGVLPVLNEEVIRMATMFGLAVNATVSQRSIFARKNSFIRTYRRAIKSASSNYRSSRMVNCSSRMPRAMTSASALHAPISKKTRESRFMKDLIVHPALI